MASSEVKRPRGRPKKFRPSPEDAEALRKRGMQVRMMSSAKATLPAMAKMIGITEDELQQQFADDIAMGQEYVYAAVALRLVNSAMGGDMRAMLAWLRQFGGWQEVTRKELTGKNGEPIAIRNLDDTALAAIFRSLTAGNSLDRGSGRDGSPLEIGRTIDLDPVPGPSDEGDGEPG
jgi:hypothetical protein